MFRTFVGAYSENGATTVLSSVTTGTFPGMITATAACVDVVIYYSQIAHFAVTKSSPGGYYNLTLPVDHSLSALGCSSTDKNEFLAVFQRTIDVGTHEVAVATFSEGAGQL